MPVHPVNGLADRSSRDARGSRSIWGTPYRFGALAALSWRCCWPSSRCRARFRRALRDDRESGRGAEERDRIREGRIYGFIKGFELWAANPLSGVGPGAWRPAMRQLIESHNLIGHRGRNGWARRGGVRLLLALLGEFAGDSDCATTPEWQAICCSPLLPPAIGVSVFLLLLLGMGGH
ncbi:MAG: hypothetical protein U0792_07585 [Gemmataceae bacterium]